MNRLHGVLAASLTLVGVVGVSSVTTAELDVDTGFGGDGAITVTLLDEVGAMTVDGVGRTLLVGLKNDTPSIGHVAIARYLPNGNPDTSFSGDGRVDLAASAISFRAGAIRVLTNGTVVIAGERFGLNATDQSTAKAMLVARLSTAGVPQDGFGSSGLLTLPSALYGLGRAAVGPDGTAVMTVIDGFGPSGRNHHVVSPTGTVSVLQTIDQSSLGECFNSSQPPRGPFVFVTASEVVYTADSENPTASCAGGDEPGLFVVRSSLTSNDLWVKRVPAGAFVANSVAVKLDANGDACIFTRTGADLLIDVNGYVPDGSLVGTLTPVRLLDTRTGASTVDGQSAGGPRPLAGSVTKVRIAGRGGVPTNATTAIVNLTVVLPDGPGFATVYPCTPAPRNSSNINFLAGAFVANSVTAKLDANGDVCIFTLTGADLLIDVSGFVAPVDV